MRQDGRRVDGEPVALAGRDAVSLAGAAGERLPGVLEPDVQAEGGPDRRRGDSRYRQPGRQRRAGPTVIATATVTCSMMVTLPVALPLTTTFVGDGAAATSAVMPARYWPGAVPRGTLSRNRSRSPVPGGSVTARGKPVTQQPTPEQGRKAWVKVVPPLAAVPPVDRLLFRSLAAWPGLLMNALALTDRPGARPSTKYEPAFPLLPLAGISPSGWLRPLAAPP